MVDPSKTQYNIGAAYAASTLVAVVRAVPGTGKRDPYGNFDGQKATVVTRVKGEAKGDIELAGIHGAGTDFNGIALPEKGEFLALLTGAPKYAAVDSGSACPNLFEVKDGKVRLGKKELAVKELKKYFEGKPEAIPAF